MFAYTICALYLCSVKRNINTQDNITEPLKLVKALARKKDLQIN